MTVWGEQSVWLMRNGAFQITDYPISGKVSNRKDPIFGVGVVTITVQMSQSSKNVKVCIVF